MRKSERVFPDTNVILRYLLKDIPDQFAATESFFEEVRIGRKQAVILESVLVECLHVLTKYYGVPRGEAASPLSELLCYKGIANEDAALLIHALNLYGQTTLDPVDCILAAQVREGTGKLFSFDKALNKTVEAGQ